MTGLHPLSYLLAVALASFAAALLVTRRRAVRR